MPIIFASLIILAPLYVWRFSIGGLPTNFLMIASFVVIGIGLVTMLRTVNWWENLKKSLVILGRPMLIAICVFGLASIISLVAFGVSAEKIAQWMVLYAQPLALFCLVRFFLFISPEETKQKWYIHFRTAVYIVVGAAGLLALVQYFTLFTLPPAWWGNANEPKRAIAFFAHANAFGLFVTPLLAWLLPDVIEKLRAKNYWWPLLWALGGAGMFLSLSRGAWIGIVAAVGVYALLAANKKMILGLAAIGVVVLGIVAVTPNLRYRVLLPFKGEKSTVARFSLWNTGWAEIQDNPILGKGINGFSDNWDEYNKDPNLDHYNFPHNILLNFWIDSGLLGLVSMMAILALAVWNGIRLRQNKLALGMLLFVVAMVIHGLIDIPYFKNDLALIFWLLLSLI